MSDGDKLPSGHTITIIKGDDEERLKKLSFMYTDGVVRANPGNWIFQKNFLKFCKLHYDFKLKSTDIFVTSFPKSGTTWVQEIVWDLIHNPDLDNPNVYLSIDAKFPEFEADMYIVTTGAPPPELDGDPMRLFQQLCPGKDWREGILLHLASLAPSPRMIKTHLPFCFLPPELLDTCKVVYIAREPRDVMSSLYHYMRLLILWGFTGTLDEFVDLVIRDEIPFAPYWSHMKLAWEKRNHPNMCFVFFEDLKNNPEVEIRKIDKLLGTNRNDQQIKNIVEHTSFSQMKERTLKNPPSSNDGKYFNAEVAEKEGGFFRKGVTGDWKSCFTHEQADKLNAWLAKNLQQFGDDFKYKEL